MKGLLLRKGNEPEVVDSDRWFVADVATVLGNRAIRGHVLPQPGVQGQRLTAWFGGLGPWHHEVMFDLTAERPVLVLASEGTDEFVDMDEQTVLMLCAMAVAQEHGLAIPPVPQRKELQP